MKIEELMGLYAGHAGMQALEKAWENGSKNLFLQGLLSSSSPLVLATAMSKGRLKGCPMMLAVLTDQEDAGYFYHDLTQLVGKDRVLFFPSSFKRAVKYGQRDSASEVLRTEVLTHLAAGVGAKDFPLFVVTHPDALAEGVASRQSLSENSVTLSVGQTIDIGALADKLFSLGFTRTDYVYEPGQYAVRGSIIDVFSFAGEYPCRIDFFGDDIDSLRTFEVESQLSREKSDTVTLTAEKGGSGCASLFDFLPEGSAVAFRDLLWAADRVDMLPEDPTFLKREDFLRAVTQWRTIEFASHATGNPDATISFITSAQPLFHKNFDFVASTLSDYIDRGYRLCILSDSDKQNERIRAIFEERGDEIVFEPINHTLHEGFADHTLHVCMFTDHQIFDRFHKYTLDSDKARQGKVAVSLKELAEFQHGDYVVHIDHGIGRFAGLVRVPSGNGTQEAIKLVYDSKSGGKTGATDVVLVSIHSLHKISKYKGKDGEPPRLSKLGSGAWEKIKQHTKSKIKDIARDLIHLYSQRLKEEGFAYSPDSFMQHELEASFIYEDTPDQLKTTQDVKADMERARPMDRLVCGDVGFGKTEVAIRAAFKACMDNKQVAMLVPTTVLAYQHWQTFTERLKDFPVRIEYLTRARSATDTHTILNDLANGQVNIIIGTHKLIGKNVKFKDLGLLIIDEEQKFGVSVKERLKQLKVNVDTLTLTATPIPRTLQFSLMGARDLSIIQTPPPNRYPIQTEVHTFDEAVISDAINFEMARGGQVFFINNRVQNLPELAALVQRLVPDARVAIGHGQMDPAQLEKTVLGFINFDYDVLIATSIVENGVDIPNANTIIINQAHTFGLSDLHQMRGRVGRSNKKAFCYLLAPPMSSLSEDSRRRLVAIENFTDLGSGFHIAMQDLDIRGAGNLLGAEQSGFIADLGYETYQKILGEAVHELRTEEFSDLMAQANDQSDDAASAGEWSYVEECSFDSDLELLFPDSYIPTSGERILLYRELDSLTTDAEVELYRRRLEDRFGHLPIEGEELLRVVPLRRMAAALGIEKIILKQGRMALYFVSDTESPYYDSPIFHRVLQRSGLIGHECRFRETSGRQSLLVSGISSVQDALEVVKKL